MYRELMIRPTVCMVHQSCRADHPLEMEWLLFAEEPDGMITNHPSIESLQSLSYLLRRSLFEGEEMILIVF